jgi:hypothetical protein
LSFGFDARWRAAWRAARYLEKEKLRRISNELEKRRAVSVNSRDGPWLPGRPLAAMPSAVSPHRCFERTLRRCRYRPMQMPTAYFWYAPTSSTTPFLFMRVFLICRSCFLFMVLSFDVLVICKKKSGQKKGQRTEKGGDTLQ